MPLFSLDPRGARFGPPREYGERGGDTPRTRPGPGAERETGFFARLFLVLMAAASSSSAVVTPNSASKEYMPQLTPPGVSASAAGGSSRKRKSRDGGGSSSGVRFASVTVRTFGCEVWGGGGVPADDGPPLGLGWDIKGEHSVGIDEYEEERAEEGRTPKDSYCMEGAVEPEQRRRMLMNAGSTMKQIKAAQKAVAQLNQDRWKVNGTP